MNKKEQIVFKLLNPFFARKKYQTFFENLLSLSHFGLNYGLGGDVKYSGETYVIELMKAKFKAKDLDNVVFFDVGANIGDYTQILIKNFEGQAFRVYSFEPNSRTFQTLRKNLPHESNIRLFNLGLGSKEEVLNLYYDAPDSPYASLYDRINMPFTIKEEVQIYSLDLFCKENNIEEIHFLKMDVEGHELKVLEGASELIQNNKIHTIQFEFGPANVDSRTFFKDYFYLLKENFNLYRILKDGLHPITVYSENFEIFKTNNFLAEMKS